VPVGLVVELGPLLAFFIIEQGFGVQRPVFRRILAGNFITPETPAARTRPV